MENNNLESALATTMHANVLRLERCRLLVCDCDTRQEVVVHTPAAQCFRPGDCVCIEYSGAMTRSIPPQISATCITKLC